MSSEPSNLYAQWRAEWLSGQALREAADGSPPESLVRAIWQHQRLRRESLRTLDGSPLRIWHPGFPSAEPGPDFKNAIIQVGDGVPKEGDVEVDLQAGGWRAHGHDRNPAFAKVALHVVWSAEHTSTPLPTLVVRDILDAPIAELELWLDREPAGMWPESLRGRCTAPLKELSREALVSLLHEAARVRWESKAVQFRARARTAGWDQAFWEGMFRALGYKHNVWPMHSLAESRHGWAAEPADVLQWQARLLGLSNLLPNEVPRDRRDKGNYLREIWDCWWRERDALMEWVLPKGAWRLAGLRPANRPERRLALAAHWFARGDVISRLEAWFASKTPKAKLAPSLLDVLQASRDSFWCSHWTLRSGRLERSQPLLGLPRVTDLAVNVILPWFWVRAMEGKRESLQREAEWRFLNWPAGEDNAKLKFARQRLLGGGGAPGFSGAAAQQGLLQVLRDFCAHSNALCDHCQFPEFVRRWEGSRG